MSKTTLQERIKKLLSDKRVSMTDFAKQTGISRGTLYDAFKRETEDGAHNIDGETARLIADRWGVSLAWVMTGNALGEAQPSQTGTEPSPFQEQLAARLVLEPYRYGRKMADQLAAGAVLVQFKQQDEIPVSIDDAAAVVDDMHRRLNGLGSREAPPKSPPKPPAGRPAQSHR